jgi:colanic acid biosynthesis protein WcaH
MSWLDQQTFRTVVQHTPLVAIDLIVENSVGEILLGVRCNCPAQGQWFVPGGRITKDETIPSAFSRLTEVELGLSMPIDKALFQGVYEHHYLDNYVDERFSTHYVVLAYRLSMELDLNELPADQHCTYRWWPQAALLEADKVHRHTKWYFGAE